jgi:hypothetical protein
MENYDPEDHTDLIEEQIDPIREMEEKLRRGRVKYGPEWVGNRAIIEAHEEALDLGAYLLSEYNGDNQDIDNKLLEELIRSTINLIHGVRMAISMMVDEAASDLSEALFTDKESQLRSDGLNMDEDIDAAEAIMQEILNCFGDAPQTCLREAEQWIEDRAKERG